MLNMLTGEASSVRICTVQKEVPEISAHKKGWPMHENTCCAQKKSREAAESELCLEKIKQEIAANCQNYIWTMDPFPWPSEIKFFAFVLLWFKFSWCQLMLGPANSNSDQPITIIFAYDIRHTRPMLFQKACVKCVLKTRKWNVTKWNVHHVGMKIIWWNGPQDIKATKSEGSRPTVERQKCKPCKRYPLFDQGYP